jgi:DNA-binding response OmpR family regulator
MAVLDASVDAVAKGRVLIIEADEWARTLLAKFLADGGFEVHLAGAARQGFEMARRLEPDCIVCDVVLPDVDGFWVARRVRTDRSRIATTPFLFLTGERDSESRLTGLNVGADVYLTKPFRNEEVVAQIEALIEMANRLRVQRDSFLEAPSSSAERPAFRGDIAFLSVATMLTMLDLERRAGILKVQSGPSKVEFEIVDGTITDASRGGTSLPVIDALRVVLEWRSGQFWFRPVDIPVPSGPRHSINALLLQAMRLRDEAER